MAEYKQGSDVNSLNLSKIRLENKNNDIQRNITNRIKYYNNTYSNISTQNQNKNNIYNISRKIENAESERDHILRSIREYGGVQFSRANSKWQEKVNSYDRQLKFLRQDLAQAKLNKNMHNKSRKFITIEKKKLQAKMRDLQPKENEIRWGGKHHKTHKRRTNKRRTNTRRTNKRRTNKRRTNTRRTNHTKRNRN